MASRRSRLKAVANLPIRRKLPSVHQEVESVKILKADDDKTNSSALTAEDKGQGVKESDDVQNSTETNDDAQNNDVNVAVQPEPEKQNSDNVPLTGSPNPKVNKGVLVSRFGRRVKPSVSLNFLRDKPQRDVNDGESIKQNEKPNCEENHLSTQDSNNQETPENSSGNNLTDSESTNQGVSSLTLSETSNTKSIPFNETGKNGSAVNTAESDKEDSSQSQPELIFNNNEKQINNERTSEFNIGVPVNNLKPNFSVDDTRFSAKYSQGAVNKQRNELPQNQNILSNYSLNQLASHSGPQVQYSSAGFRRNLTTFKQKKPKFNDFARKVADARREFQRKYEKIPPDRSSLRMIDLIFYNPSTNPMESKSRLERKDSHMGDEELLNESKVDDPEPLEKPSDISQDDDSKIEDSGKMPVPQVKIGLNGEIILDEKSLVIETTDAKRGREDLQNSAPVFEDKNSKTGYYKRKTQKSRDWSDAETKRFYKALNTIGTDFSLMQKYFPVRTRLELKNKFKREEKLNRNLIDKALNNPSEFDINQFEKYLAMEKKIQEEEAEKRLQRKIKIKRTENKVRTRSSLLAREITEPDENDVEDDAPERVENRRLRFMDKAKQIKGINILCRKYSLTELEENPSHSSSTSEGGNNGNNLSSSSKIFTSVGLSELKNISKIRDAYDEIQSLKNPEKAASRMEALGSISRAESTEKSGESRDTTRCGGIVDEFYQAVVNLSASLKSGECNNVKSNRARKRVRTNLVKNDKRKINQSGRKNAKKSKDYPFLNTLDIETYESDCDNCSSSNESNDNSVVSTKTITDQDFIKLLAANAKNMKESKIQFQITEGCSLEKNVEIILDNVPSIALSEI